MLRAVWFFVQLCAIVVASVWILELPGELSLNFMDYTVRSSFGVAMLLLAVLLIVALLCFRVLLSVVSLPAFLVRKKQEANRKNGYRAMTRGFAAVAAGNASAATKFSKQVRRFLPDEQGLPLLLDAQTARLRGDHDKAKKIFQELLKDKDASFFGVRGLLKAAMDEGNAKKALEYAQQAKTLNPKQPWILRTVYDLELQNQKWDDALLTAKKALRVKAIEQSRAHRDHVAILLHQARTLDVSGQSDLAKKKIEQAYKKDKVFVPTVLALCDVYWREGKKRKVKSILTVGWKDTPHPDLLSFWQKLAPEITGKNSSKYLKFYERIVSLKPDSVYSQMAAAQACIDIQLWGEAKSYLNAAEKIENLAQIHRMRAEVEKNSTQNEEMIRDWLLKASDASAGKIWHCTLTGHIYDRWSAIAMPHGSFNTIDWGYPQRDISALSSLSSLPQGEDALLIDSAA